MATNDAFGQFETLLRETISESVLDLRLETDDVSWALLNTFQPVDKAGRMTEEGGYLNQGVPDGSGHAGAAGWEASWRVKHQGGGRVTGGTFAGTTITQMGSEEDLTVGQAVNELYLDPAQTPLASYYSVKMLLKRIKGQVTLNRDQLLARMASEPLEDVAAEYVEDATTDVRHHITSHFWSDGTGSLAQANLSSTTTVPEAVATVRTNLTSPANIIEIDGGTIYRFRKGMRVVFGTDAEPRVLIAGDGAAGATGVARVVEIDIDNRRVFFQSEVGVGDIDVVDDAHIMIEGNYDFSQSTHAAASKAPAGIENLITNSGTFPGTNWNVARRQELKGFVSGSEAAKVPPTPEIMAKMVDKITDAKKAPPPVWIGEQSVFTYYNQLERESGATYPVPQGSPFTASGGVEGPRFSHNGMTFQKLTSSQCRPGAIHGITPSTWKKFMPLGDLTVKWAINQGGAAGAPSVFRPVTSGRQLSELLAADFDVFCQFGCDDPRRNFRQIGLHNQRDV